MERIAVVERGTENDVDAVEIVLGAENCHVAADRTSDTQVENAEVAGHGADDDTQTIGGITETVHEKRRDEESANMRAAVPGQFHTALRATTFPMFICRDFPPDHSTALFHRIARTTFRG